MEENMEELLSLKESIVTYLDRSEGLRKLVDTCQSLNDLQQMYRFSFDVNPSDIVELDARLGDCILHNPLKATSLFQSVCFLSIKTLSLIEHIHTESQVNVVLRPTHMPPFPSYNLDLSTFPRGYYLMRPVTLEGLVIAMTCVTKYTQGARFICAEEKCPCSRDFHHIRVHAPGATESATVRSHFICFLCSSPLKEDVKSRVLGDKQLVELVHMRALGVLGVHEPFSIRYQSVTLFLRDELCNTMKIGQLYRVVGIPAHVLQWPNITYTIEACSIQNLMPKFPPGLYSTLKLALLLSLVQTKEENLETHNHLDVLAFTGDTLIVERLMTYSLGLSARGIRHPVAGELFTSLSRDEHGAGTANIHAGSALLAAGGVCLLGDLTCYKKDRIDTLQSALDSRAVSVFIPGKKYGEDADKLISIPITCNFWALADGLTASKKANRPDNLLLGTVEMGPVPPTVIDAFGLVIHCREPASNHPHLPMTIHTLRQAISPGEPIYPACMQFNTQDYTELLAYARHLKVDMSTESEQMIHGYYMASRRLRSSVSVTSIKLLITLAQAHAKLNLRTLVMEEDAVIAVLLCENSFTVRHGASALVIPPDAVFPCDLRDLESLHRRDLTLNAFHQQILQFIYNYAPGAATYITEE